MKNVLLIASKPSSSGGVNIWTGIVLRYFENHPQNIKIKLLDDERSVLPTDNVNKVLWILYALKDYTKVLIRLLCQIRNNCFDVVHIVSSGRLGILRDWLYVFILHIIGVKTIVHYHCGTLPETLSSSTILATCIKYIGKTSTIIVLDEASKTCLEENGFLSVFKIGNPYNEKIDNINASSRINNSILFVGQFLYSKGVRELIVALHDIPDIILNCYGIENAQVKAEILEYIKKNGFKGEIHFHGMQSPETVFAAMKQSNLFVLPTYTEGFPFVIIEAMACGCPIITTPVGAIEEMITYQGASQAYLVPPQNTELLKSQILYCLNNPEEIERKSESARQKAVEYYSTDAIMNELIKVWNNV